MLGKDEVMTITPITEYPPILPIGFHRMSLKNLEEQCVKRFPDSMTRQQIMTGLRDIIQRLSDGGIRAEIWVNGSFLTRKRDPRDADIVLRIPIQVYENGNPEQKALLEWVHSNLKLNHHCDSYVFFVFPPEDSRSVCNDYLHAYWIKQFGFSRGQEMKGIAVLEIGGAS